MNFLELLNIEFMKVKRSKIVPLIFIAPLLVVASGVASLSRYFTPEYTNAWPAMFIQSALVYAYRSEEHTSELQSRFDLVCRLLLANKTLAVRQIVARRQF